MAQDTRLTAAFNRIAAAIKSNRMLINGNAADLSALTTSSKTSIVSAINELQTEVDSAAGGGAAINDGTTSASSVWSSSKTSSEINSATGDIANKVDYSEAQTLTEPQKVQARTNIGAGTSDLTIGTTGSTAKAGNYTPPTASTTTTGTVELATSAETTTGTDTTRAVTPQGLKAVTDTLVTSSATGNLETDYVAIIEAALL